MSFLILSWSYLLLCSWGQPYTDKRRNCMVYFLLAVCCKHLNKCDFRLVFALFLCSINNQRALTTKTAVYSGQQHYNENEMQVPVLLTSGLFISQRKYSSNCLPCDCSLHSCPGFGPTHQTAHATA